MNMEHNKLDPKMENIIYLQNKKWPLAIIRCIAGKLFETEFMKGAIGKIHI